MALVFKLPKDYPTEGTTVVRIVVGDKFFIAHTAKFEYIETAIKKAYGKYKFRGGLREDNIWLPVVKSLYDQGKETIFVDVLFNSEDGYKVMQFEAIQLAANYGKAGSLNPNKEPLMPKLNTGTEATAKKWLTLTQAGNYSRHVVPKTEQIVEANKHELAKLNQEKLLLSGVVNNTATKKDAARVTKQYGTKVAMKARIAEIKKIISGWKLK